MEALVIIGGIAGLFLYKFLLKQYGENNYLNKIEEEEIEEEEIEEEEIEEEEIEEEEIEEEEIEEEEIEEEEIEEEEIEEEEIEEEENGANQLNNVLTQLNTGNMTYGDGVLKNNTTLTIEKVKELLRLAIIKKRKIIFTRTNQQYHESKRYLIQKISSVGDNGFKAQRQKKDGFDEGGFHTLNLNYEGFTEFIELNEDLIVDNQIFNKAIEDSLYNDKVSIGKTSKKKVNLDKIKKEFEAIDNKIGYKKAKIIQIDDGDGGVLIEEELNRVAFRIGGIDAPEMDEKDSKLSILASNSKDRLEELIGNQIVYIKVFILADSYGRQIIEIINTEGDNIGCQMLSEGLAIPLFFEDNLSINKAIYIDAAKYAHSLGIGVWGIIKNNLLKDMIAIQPISQFKTSNNKKSTFIREYLVLELKDNNSHKWSFQTVIAGLEKHQFHTIKDNLKNGDSLTFELNKNNTSDKRAVEIYFNQIMIGHIPDPFGRFKGDKFISRTNKIILCEALSNNKKIDGEITSITLSKKNTELIKIKITIFN